MPSSLEPWQPHLSSKMSLKDDACDVYMYRVIGHVHVHVRIPRGGVGFPTLATSLFPFSFFLLNVFAFLPALVNYFYLFLFMV